MVLLITQDGGFKTGNILSVCRTSESLLRRDFAQKAKSREGTLVTRAYSKESTYSLNIQSYSQYRKNLDLLEQREGPQGIGR